MIGWIAITSLVRQAIANRGLIAIRHGEPSLGHVATFQGRDAGEWSIWPTCPTSHSGPVDPGSACESEFGKRHRGASYCLAPRRSHRRTAPGSKTWSGRPSAPRWARRVMDTGCPNGENHEHQSTDLARISRRMGKSGKRTE